MTFSDFLVIAFAGSIIGLAYWGIALGLLQH